MRELVVILPDFFSISSDAHSAAALSAVALPRLPHLEGLLARATHAALPGGDWRGWLREHVAGPALSPAATVAAAWGLPADPAHGYWLATPVHLFAGLDSVRLHPQGLLRLSGAEQQRLVSEFARVFADSPWRLLARDRRELLLAGPALSAGGADPAPLLGADPSAGMPRGTDAATLRRLASEIELWLHEHPLNLERQRDAQLPVTALWLWGNAPADPQASASDAAARAPHEPHGALPALAGEDTYAQALWQLGGAPLGAQPQPAAALTPETVLGAPRGGVLLQRVCEPPGVAANLDDLERRWWAPVRAALRARRLSALYLVTGTHVHALSWWSLARLWRVRRPWWELL
ncbi:MAG TPA: hypothetical protein VHY19_12645 [Steroidobacteraceae bacterium]|nr:hypothetical protein [Steroidobacteraceae bacterium]